MALRDDRAYVGEAVDAMARAAAFIGQLPLEEFLLDEKTQSAVVRQRRLRTDKRLAVLPGVDVFYVIGQEGEGGVAARRRQPVVVREIVLARGQQDNHPHLAAHR